MGFNALAYTSLVGRYVRMERLSTVEELATTSQQTVGMEARIVAVWDDSGDVIVAGDYGETWRITAHDADDWTFTVWESEKARHYARTPREFDAL